MKFAFVAAAAAPSSAAFGVVRLAATVMLMSTLSGSIATAEECVTGGFLLEFTGECTP
jgi:hypothetical protein